MRIGNRLLRSALLLTLVNLLLRFAGTGFQVWLSGQIGAAGLGLLQLILSVNMLALTLGAAGGRTAAMYLTAGELGRGNRDNADRLLAGCFVYSILCSGAVGTGLFVFGPELAAGWIGTTDALISLRTWAAFLPVICLTGVMTGYFTAAGRIGTLAAVEVGEQCVSIAVTAAALSFIRPADRAEACRAVVLGSCFGSVVTLISLMVLYIPKAGNGSSQIRVLRPVLRTAVPLAVTDDLRAGVSAVENLMVPRRLMLYGGISDPLAAFGRVSGMVFPVLMFPTAILGSLAEVLIPELARCAAIGSNGRIQYLIRRNLRITAIYGLMCGGILFLTAVPLCSALYPGQEAGILLRRFALLAPMLYCDLISDAMLKGLGAQTACARYSIISNILDIGLMYFLLPELGLDGYFLSFTLTHALNFGLGLRRLLKIGNVKLKLRFPLLTASSALFGILGGSCFEGPVRRTGAFLGLLFSLCMYTGILGKDDLRWLRGLIHGQSDIRAK
jgi:stage V sporulation protein B